MLKVGEKLLIAGAADPPTRGSGSCFGCEDDDGDGDNDDDEHEDDDDDELRIL